MKSYKLKKGKKVLEFSAFPQSNKVIIPGKRTIKYRRDFGGKRKLVFMGISSKKDALKTAKFRRKIGLKARVVKSKAGYILYG